MVVSFTRHAGASFNINVQLNTGPSFSVITTKLITFSALKHYLS